MGAPTIHIDGKIATKDAAETQHGSQCAPLHMTPSLQRRPPAEPTTRENIDRRQSEDEGRDGMTINKEDQWENQEGNRGGTYIAYGTQWGMTQQDSYAPGVTFSSANRMVVQSGNI